MAPKYSPEKAKEARTVSKRGHRHKKRAAGLCGYEGCKVETGDIYYCETHRRRKAAKFYPEEFRRAG